MSKRINFILFVTMAFGVIPLSFSKDIVEKSKIDQLVNIEMLGVNQSYFASIAGIPRVSDENSHEFIVDNCLIRTKVQDNKVRNIRLELTSSCDIKLNEILHNYDVSNQRPITPKILADANPSISLNYSADCIQLCGSAYEPSIYAHWAGSRADGSLEIMLEMYSNNDEASDATFTWADHMKSKKGFDYVIDTQFNCDNEFNDFAHSLFMNVPVNAISIGYDLEYYNELDYKNICGNI